MRHGEMREGRENWLKKKNRWEKHQRRNKARAGEDSSSVIRPSGARKEEPEGELMHLSSSQVQVAIKTARLDDSVVQYGRDASPWELPRADTPRSLLAGSLLSY